MAIENATAWFRAKYSGEGKYNHLNIETPPVDADVDVDVLPGESGEPYHYEISVRGENIRTEINLGGAEDARAFIEELSEKIDAYE